MMPILCKACEKIFSGRSKKSRANRQAFGLPLFFLHHKNGGFELQRSAAEGCQLCTLLWNQLTPPEREAVCPNFEALALQPCPLETDYRIEKHGTSYLLNYLLEIPNGDWTSLKQTVSVSTWGSYMRKEVYILESNRYQDILESSNQEAVVDRNQTTWSLPAQRLARQWITTCKTDHKSCQKKAGAGSYPTRLVHVGTNEDPDLKLVQGHDIPLGAGYTTLSHCWGASVPFRLTTSNHSALQVAIPLVRLPETFLDAIAITRDLGVHYLWIDSLCIIQDSRDDWSVESMTMGSVYSNSYCNISATASADANGGCIRARDPTQTQLLTIDQHISTRPWYQFLLSGKTENNLSPSQSDHIFRYQNFNKPFPVSSTLSPGSYMFLSPCLWDDLVSSSPVNSRAWVLQEHLLSPRTLHFSSNQLFFECASLKACESFPTVVRNLRTGFSSSGMSGSVQQWRHLLSYSPAWERSWRSIVERYSQAQLSQSSDKLVAISGLAQIIHSVHKASYIAGLYTSEFLPQLLWRTEDFALHPRPTYRAPSWSWAAIDGEVSYLFSGGVGQDFRMLVDVLETKCETLNGNAFGEVTTASLELRCQILPATLTARIPEHNPPPSWSRFQLVSKHIGNDIFFYPDAIEESLGGAFCLPIIVSSSKLLTGLVLRAQQTPGQAMRRLGLFVTSISQAKFDQLSSPLASNSRTIIIV